MLLEIRMIKQIIKIQILLLLFSSMFIFGCSEGDKIPTNPIYTSGNCVIFNEANVPIRLLEYSQIRGELSYNSVLNRRVNPGFSYSLINEFDGGNSDRFPARDMIIVHFIADTPDPNAPERPLFENTIDRAVNGNTTILVKTGGDFSVAPG